GDGERAARQLGRRDRAVAHARRQGTRLARDLAERLAVGIEDGRHDQRPALLLAALRRHRDADIDATVQLQSPVAVTGVCARVRPTSVVAPLAVTTASAGCWRGSSGTGAAVEPPRGALSTSRLTIRPPGPVPVRPCRSTPRSRAMRLASGEALTRPARGGGGGCCGAAAGATLGAALPSASPCALTCSGGGETADVSPAV